MRELSVIETEWVFILMHKIKNRLALLEKRQEGNHGEQIRRTSHTKTKPNQTIPSCKINSSPPVQPCSATHGRGLYTGPVFAVGRPAARCFVSTAFVCLLTTLLPLSIQGVRRCPSLTGHCFKKKQTGV